MLIQPSAGPAVVLILCILGLDVKSTFARECGGVLTAPTGVIASPNYPNNYGNDQICYWYINAQPGQTVTLYFTHFNLEVKSDCSYDRVKLYNGNTTSSSSQMAKLCGEMPSQRTYNSSSNSMVVNFKTDGSNVRTGFRATYTLSGCGGVVTDPTGVISYPYSPNLNNVECIWYINGKPGQEVRLTFIDFERETNSHCVKVYNGNDTRTSSEMAQLCTEEVPSQTIYDISSNSMVVYFKTGGSGFRATYSFHDCGGVLTASRGVITSPAYPDNYLNNMDCYWHINGEPGQAVRLHFTEFELEAKSDCVKLYNGNSTRSSSELATLCTEEMPSQRIYDSSSHSMVVFFKSDASGFRSGFRATYTINECGGVLTAPTGVITSPNYPDNYFSNMDCYWYINAQPGSIVRLNITDFNMEPKSDCVNLYNGNITSTSSKMATLCTGEMPVQRTYDSFSDSMVLNFKTDETDVRSGFRATYTIYDLECGGVLTAPTGVITSPNYPDNYFNNLDCSWYINAQPGQTVRLHFTDFNLETKSDCVKLYNGNSTNTSLEIDSMCSEDMINQRTYNSSSNSMVVYFKTDGTVVRSGFKATYAIHGSECGGLLTAPNGVITSPNYPNNYTNNLECYWYIQAQTGQSVSLHFSDFNLETKYDCVKVYNGFSTIASSEIANLCTEGMPHQRTYDSKSMVLYFKTDGSVVGSGFKATYTINECGGVLTAPTGVITSPNYPDDYFNNLDCYWYINAQPGRTVSISFSDFTVEKKYDCVKLYTGNTTSASFETETLCTEEMPSPRTFVSSTNSMVVFFKSDASVVRSGFRATYTINECGGVLTDSTGVITSPYYPNDYSNNLDCSWYISVKPGRTVRLNISDANLETKHDCVKVYNGNITSQASEIANTCTDGVPSQNLTYTSSSNSMVVYFKTDGSIVHSGFYATYATIGCGGVLTAPTGMITSPNYPDDYTNNLECYWYINGTPQQVVRLVFTDFELEDKSDCVMVYNGNSTSPSSEMANLCTGGMPSQRTYDASHNSMVVYFKTDGSGVRPGFRANYTIFDSECGGVLTAATGVITSPNYPDNYFNNLDCSWHINAQPGQTVRVHFTDFSLESKSDCVKVYNGNSTSTSPEMANLCTEVIPSPRTYDSSSNSMVVYFKSDGSVVRSGFRATYTINSSPRG